MPPHKIDHRLARDADAERRADFTAVAEIPLELCCDGAKALVANTFDFAFRQRDVDAVHAVAVYMGSQSK